ncbi:MAG: hypothetical protein GXO74_13235, partial [Calditrichaeota bacterium]|nr:hypothetical protein [Calditrichota bacterium]
EEIQLYCAGYDDGDNFVGNIPVQWSSNGNLTPAVSGSGTSVSFQPTLAPASGQIVADHASATDDTTGLISVIPGAPVGVISLTASPSVLPADGVSTSAIESNNILDSDGNRIAAGTQFTVNATMGSILSTDVNPILTGKQVAADDSGKIYFVFQVSDTGGTAFISVSSVNGSASGYTSVLMNSLQISKVSSSVATVSQGQNAAPVAMLVENLGPKTITGLTAGLIFTGPAPAYENRNSDFPQIVRTDGVTTIPSLSTRTLTFEVDVNEQAHADSVTIDGWISGQIGGVAVTDTFAILKGKWKVQTPAEIKITRVYSVLDTVSQGGRGIGVRFYVSNTGEAGANVSLDTLSFWSVNEAVDVTSDYEILSAPTNPTFLPGASANNVFDFTVNVGSAATLGSVVINGQVMATDQNSAKQTNDFNADTTHTWYVKSAPIVGIKGFYPSQNLVTKNQTVPWYLTLLVENNGETNVRLEDNTVAFFLKGADVSSEYQVTVPNKFKNSGSNILSGNSADTLIYTVTKTGSSTGEITIRGRIFLRDLGTGNQIVDESLTGVSVLKSAKLNVTGIIISQNSVTRNQTQDWTVDVALENKGGTDIVIDTFASRSFLRFGAASDFQVRQPTAFKDGDLTLEAGKLDTLRFIVDKTTATPGNYFINAHFSGYQITSGDSIYADSQDSTLIVVENPAKLRIYSLQNLAENSPYVNTAQNFWLRIKLQNLGQDKIKQAQVHLTTNGPSSISQSTLTFTDISGFTSKSDTFFITAANSPVSSEKFSVSITQAEAENTAEALGVEFGAALDSVETVTIQQPANLVITNITAPDTVRASQSETWKIKIAVRNSGGANLILATPQASDIIFSVEGGQKSDYIVQPPTGLAGGGLALSGGSTDTLIYLVNHTGEDAGAGEILGQIEGTDKNSGQVLSAQKTRNFYVRSTAAVQLVRTLPICPNYNSQLDRGVVDRGQNFSVRVWVRNLGRKKVKNVQVQLTTDGGSVIAEPIREINSIEHNALDSLDFQITANPNNPVDYEFFTSKIISAKEYDTNLPAAIDNSGDDRALIAITDSAKLSVSAHTEKDFSDYTINQIFTLHAQVENIGAPPALVDSSGTMMVKVPENYRIIVGEDTVQDNNLVAFYPGVTFDWHILTPEIASGPDTIIVSLLHAPLDINLLEPAQVNTARDTVVVSTVATNILDSTFVADPEGARDGTLSTQQEFVVESDIQFSQNIEQVWATLSLSAVDNNYRFQIPADSTQEVASLVPVRWKLTAPVLADEHEQLLLITIRADEVGNPIPLIYKDTVRVRSVLRAELKFTARISYPEGAKDGQVTTGQRYEIKAEVKNNGTADVYGDGLLFINLGSTGSNFADTTETVIKPFKIDSAVTWSLRASETPVSESFLQIGYAENGVPKDENTNALAYYHPNEDRVNISVTTVPGGNVDLTAKIQGPAGALDGVISTDQRMSILAQIHSTGVRDVESELILPGDFSFAPNVSPVQPGESSAQWEIVAPANSTSNAELKIVTHGIDVNNDTVFVYSDTARIVVNVVKKGLVEVVADIKSPLEATDRIVSVNQDFVIEGYLNNHGQADIQGNYQLEIILPSGYTTTDSLTKTISGTAHVEWTVRAPDHELPAANIAVRVPPGVGPRDENSGKEMEFWNANRSTSIAITTYEKSVELSVLPNRAPNTIVSGQGNISMLGLRIFNGAQDEVSNAVILSGLELLVSDRFGEPLNNPGQVVSRLLVRDYSDENLIYADITSLAENSLINVTFTRPDTIEANKIDSIDVVINITASPAKDNLKIIIPADSSIRITEALTGNIPSITGINGGEKYFVESDFVIIRGNNLKESFGNYPNPFGSKDRPKTTITYYLKEDTKVDIKIYTLIGELVWSRSFTADDPQGKKGMRDGDVVWDAKNDRGKKVLNGIYVIYLKTGYGETATTKAVVVK